MRFFQKSREKAKTLLSSATTTTERRNRKEKTHVECANSVASSSIYVTCVRVSIVLLFFLRARARSFFFSFSSPFSENFKTLNSIAEKKISAHTRFTHKTHSAAHSRLKHTHTHTNTRTREREREREKGYDRRRVLLVSQLAAVAFFQPGDGVGFDRCELCWIFTGKSVCFIFPFSSSSSLSSSSSSSSKTQNARGRGALAGRSALLRSRLNERARERGEICSRNTCFLVWFPNKFSDRFLFLSFV